MNASYFATKFCARVYIAIVLLAWTILLISFLSGCGPVSSPKPRYFVVVVRSHWASTSKITVAEVTAGLNILQTQVTYVDGFQSHSFFFPLDGTSPAFPGQALPPDIFLIDCPSLYGWPRLYARGVDYAVQSTELDIDFP